MQMLVKNLMCNIQCEAMEKFSDRCNFKGFDGFISY